MNGAIARILIRYGVGAVIGIKAGEALAGNPDVVLVVAAVVGAATEYAYRVAKRKGWSL
ncbi:hypothetical protein [Citreimonas sp.]|uniref:hypothetical protein n=1 Tax=Citreimonas sp. TaxID=3036715 RepID=UPI0040598AD7